jgi:uncharacterized protein YbaR (Trm112 family)
VAIGNSRLVSIEDGQVRFRWKNYAHGDQWSTMSLSADEFIRRFLMHVLPSGFVRIRHYGLLCNRRRSGDLQRCRQLLSATVTPAESAYIQEVLPTPVHSMLASDEEHEESTTALTCPHCGKPTFRIVEEIPPNGRMPTMRMISSNRPRTSPRHQVALRGPP